jgi:acetolactate synthase small subunit
MSEPTYALQLTLHRRPGALDRVIGLLRRHGCTLVRLSFGPRGEDALDHVHLTYTGPPPARVAQQLARIVDVVRAMDPREPPPLPQNPSEQAPDAQADGHPHEQET